MQKITNHCELKRLIRISGIKWREFHRRALNPGKAVQLAYYEALDVFGEAFSPRIVRLTSYSPCREPFSLFYIEGENNPLPANSFEELSLRLVEMGCKTRRINFSSVDNIVEAA